MPKSLKLARNTWPNFMEFSFGYKHSYPIRAANF